MSYPNPDVINWLWDRPAGYRWLPLDLMRTYVIPMALGGEAIGFTQGKYLMRDASGNCGIEGVTCGKFVRFVAYKHGYILQTAEGNLDFLTTEGITPIILSRFTPVNLAPHSLGVEFRAEDEGIVMRVHELLFSPDLVEIKETARVRMNGWLAQLGDRIIECENSDGVFRLTLWRGLNLYHWHQNASTLELIRTFSEVPIDVSVGETRGSLQVLFPLGRIIHFCVSKK